MNATVPFKKVVYDTLKDSTTGTVHRAVPQGTPYPYTVVGPTTEVPDDDLSGEEGAELTITLFPYDKSNSAANLNAMIAEIDALLHNAVLTEDGLTFEVWREIMETFTERAADGATLQRGRLIYRAKTYE